MFKNAIFIDEEYSISERAFRYRPCGRRNQHCIVTVSLTSQYNLLNKTWS